MTTQEKIERKGYKVTYFASGRGVQASKGLTKVSAENITQLYKKLK